jgi:hypothetical protein
MLLIVNSDWRRNVKKFKITNEDKKHLYENKNKDQQSLDSSVRWNDGSVVGV